MTNVAMRFDRQTTISQSARTDETHHPFDLTFYKNNFPSVNSPSVAGLIVHA